MDQQQIIAQIEERVKALGLSIGKICSEAGVHPTTFSRWKASPKNPEPVSANLRNLAAIDAVISTRENRDAAA